MAIEFNSLTNGITNYIYGISFFNNVFSNVLYTSIILSILLIIILLFIYPASSDSTTGTLVKLFIYLVIVNTTILTLQHSILSNKYKDKATEEKNEAFINNITHGGRNIIYDDENIKVVPNFKEEEIPEDHLGDDCKSNQNNYGPPIIKTAAEMLDEIERAI